MSAEYVEEILEKNISKWIKENTGQQKGLVIEVSNYNDEIYISDVLKNHGKNYMYLKQVFAKDGIYFVGPEPEENVYFMVAVIQRPSYILFKQPPETVIIVLNLKGHPVEYGSDILGNSAMIEFDVNKKMNNIKPNTVATIPTRPVPHRRMHNDLLADCPPPASGRVLSLPHPDVPPRWTPVPGADPDVITQYSSTIQQNLPVVQPLATTVVHQPLATTVMQQQTVQQVAPLATTVIQQPVQQVAPLATTVMQQQTAQPPAPESFVLSSAPNPLPWPTTCMPLPHHAPIDFQAILNAGIDPNSRLRSVCNQTIFMPNSMILTTPDVRKYSSINTVVYHVPEPTTGIKGKNIKQAGGYPQKLHPMTYFSFRVC